MSVLLSLVLAVTLSPPAPSYEGAWQNEGKTQEIYLFDKGQFRVVVRHTTSADRFNTFTPIFVEKGTYKLTKVGPKKVDALALVRTDIVPPSIVRGMARNEPKRFLHFEVLSSNALMIDSEKCTRIDPESVPSSLAEAKTMQTRSLKLRK
jgi:hypothetical protein